MDKNLEIAGEDDTNRSRSTWINNPEKRQYELEIRERESTISLLKSIRILGSVVDIWGDLLSLRLRGKKKSCKGLFEKLVRSRMIMITKKWTNNMLNENCFCFAFQIFFSCQYHEHLRIVSTWRPGQHVDDSLWGSVHFFHGECFSSILTVRLNIKQTFFFNLYDTFQCPALYSILNIV